jgi:hypothetical protein
MGVMEGGTRRGGLLRVYLHLYLPGRLGRGASRVKQTEQGVRCSGAEYSSSGQTDEQDS